jgi:hypothetical protein
MIMLRAILHMRRHLGINTPKERADEKSLRAKVEVLLDKPRAFV